GPVAFPLVGFVRNRSLDHENDRAEGSTCRIVKDREEIVAVPRIEERVVKPDGGDPRKRAGEKIFEAWLGRGGHRDRTAIAPEAGREPEHVDDVERGHRSESRSSGDGHRSASLAATCCAIGGPNRVLHTAIAHSISGGRWTAEGRRSYQL